MARTATCVWRVDAPLVLALDEHLGPPVDSYLNGSQTWITDDGPGAESLEWIGWNANKRFWDALEGAGRVINV